MALQTCAAGDCGVVQWVFALFHEKHLSAIFLIGITFLQSDLPKTNAAAKTSFPQSVPVTTEALLHSLGTGYVQSCLHDCQLYANLH